jgi:hypothetical protein
MPNLLPSPRVAELLATPPDRIERVFVHADGGARSSALERMRGTLLAARHLVAEGVAPMAPGLLAAMWGGRAAEVERALLGAFQRAVFYAPAAEERALSADGRAVLAEARRRGLPVQVRPYRPAPASWSASFLTPGGAWLRWGAGRAAGAGLAAVPVPAVALPEGAPQSRTRVYVGTPLGGPTREAILENYRAALLASHQIAAEGGAPIAPHLFYCLLMEEQAPAERQLGIHLDMALMAGFERLDLCTPCGTEASLSAGMQADLERARELGLSVRYRTRPLAPADWSPSALTPGGSHLRPASREPEQCPPPSAAPRRR